MAFLTAAHVTRTDVGVEFHTVNAFHASAVARVFLFKGALLFRPNVVVTSVPFHLQR